MSFEEEFDKIVRAKAEGESYPFDEGNWEKTSSLIDADRKAVRMLKFKKLYLSALLIIGLGSASIFVYNVIKPAKQELTGLVPTAATTNSLASPSTAQGDTAPLSMDLAGNKKTKSVASENTVEEPATEKSQPIKQSLSNSTPRSSKITSAKNNPAPENHLSSVVNPTKNERTREPSINGFTAVQAKSNQNTVSERAGGDVIEPAVISKTIKISTVVPPANSTESGINESNETPSIPTDEIVSVETHHLVSDQLAAVYSNLPYERTEMEALATPFSILSRYDDDYYRNNVKKTHFINIEAGVNYLMGWDTGNGKDAKGLNWFGGLNYGFYLTKTLSVGIGVQAYNISNIKQAFYENSKKEYSFGSSTSYTLITSNDLYYLAVPLKINYSLNASNIIGFGVNAAYLMGAANTVSTYSVQAENGTSAPVLARNTGIYEGTRLTNLMLSAHYNAKLNKRINLNAELNYGLTDIFENKGSINNKETPLGFRLSLQYTLFDK